MSVSRLTLPLVFLFAAACGDGSGEVGDPCTDDSDCAEGLECHSEHEHEHEEGDEEHAEGEEGGTCEEAGEHDDHDHDHEDE